MIQPGSLWKMALEVHGGMITCADWSLKIFMKWILGANFLERNISYPIFSIYIKKVGSFFFSCQFWLGKKASYFAWHDKWGMEEAFRSSSLNFLCYLKINMLSKPLFQHRWRQYNFGKHGNIGRFMFKWAKKSVAMVYWTIFSIGIWLI